MLFLVYNIFCHMYIHHKKLSSFLSFEVGSSGLVPLILMVSLDYYIFMTWTNLSPCLLQTFTEWNYYLTHSRTVLSTSLLSGIFFFSMHILYIVLWSYQDHSSWKSVIWPLGKTFLCFLLLIRLFEISIYCGAF